MESEVEEIDDEELAELVSTTWLSKREAEIYLLKDEGYTAKDAAGKMGIEPDSAWTYWGNAKDKVRKSRETVALNIS